MTPFILRIHYIRDVEDTAAQLDDFFRYTIQSLVNQTDGDFICFIDYPYKTGIPAMYMKAHKFSDKRFIFSNKHAAESHRYVEQMDLNSISGIHFIELQSNQIFPRNMLARIRMFNYSTKVQFLNGVYHLRTDRDEVSRLRYRLMDAFIYICPIPEYRHYFFYFDERNHDSLTMNAVYMPRITLPIPYMQYSNTKGPEGTKLEEAQLIPIQTSFGLKNIGRHGS